MLFPNEHVHLTPHVYVLHLFIILVQTNTSWILIVLKCVFLRYRLKQKGGVHGKDISFLEYPCSIGKFVSYHALSHSYRTFFLQTFPQIIQPSCLSNAETHPKYREAMKEGIRALEILGFGISQNCPQESMVTCKWFCATKVKANEWTFTKHVLLQRDLQSVKLIILKHFVVVVFPT